MTFAQLTCNLLIFLTPDNAYCKNNATDKWYKYDDSHVSEISEEKVVVSDCEKILFRMPAFSCFNL